MKAIKLFGEVDDQHRLSARVPEGFPKGAVRVVVMPLEEDDAGTAWAQGLSAEWSEELSDSQQDIYTLNDGEPLNAAG